MRADRGIRRWNSDLAQANMIYDPLAGDDVVANLQLAEDGLYIFRESGKRLQHWRYDEIAHAFEPRDGNDTVLIHRARPEIRLTMNELPMYDAIVTRAPQLRSRSVHSVRNAWNAVPDQSKLAVFILVFSAILFVLYQFANFSK